MPEDGGWWRKLCFDVANSLQRSAPAGNIADALNQAGNIDADFLITPGKILGKYH
jgi:hypothetical protein